MEQILVKRKEKDRGGPEEVWIRVHSGRRSVGEGVLSARVDITGDGLVLAVIFVKFQEWFRELD